MDAPANTMSYMLAGYGVIFGIMIVYFASLYFMLYTHKHLYTEDLTTGHFHTGS